MARPPCWASFAQHISLAAPCVRLTCGYAGDKLQGALKDLAIGRMEIVKRSELLKGLCSGPPRRWVVERTFGLG